MLCLVVFFTACSKKETVESTEDFGEFQETISESTEDEFAISNQNLPGYEVRETRARDTNKVGKLSQEELEQRQLDIVESVEALEESYAKEKAEALGQEYSEPEPYIESTAENANGEIVPIGDLGNGLALDMKEQIWSGLITEEGMDELDEFINANFTEETEEGKKAVKDYIENEWEKYRKVRESLEALPPEETFSAEEVEKYPEWRNYSKKEVDYALSIGGGSGLEGVEANREGFENSQVK